jgi:hypothetical protein
MFLSVWLSLPLAILTAEPVKGQPARDPASCELVLEGKHIETLLLTDPHGQPKSLIRPGTREFLPPGQYVIVQIQLEGGYWSYPKFAEPKLILAPGKPCRANFGAPLNPTVAVKRAGRLLKLDYQLLDGDGRSYRKGDNSDRAHPPQFTIYQGDRKTGSGTFEYG